MIHVREFIHQAVYKVGKTTQANLARYKQYPKGSELILHVPSSDCDTDERAILRLFRGKYISKTDIGSEYFEGDRESMIDDICRVVRKSAYTGEQLSPDERAILQLFRGKYISKIDIGN